MNLYLIGYRGSGKSTIAPILGRLLEREHVDTDKMIEQQSGQTVREIFSQQGEPEFRKLESFVIGSIAADRNWIVSLGGGAVLAESNRRWLKATGRSVWLTASPAVLWERIQADPLTPLQRPDLTKQGGQAEVEQILAVRETVYAECADYTIDVSQLSPEQLAERVATWWRTVDKKIG